MSDNDILNINLSDIIPLYLWREIILNKPILTYQPGIYNLSLIIRTAQLDIFNNELLDDDIIELSKIPQLFNLFLLNSERKNYYFMLLDLYNEREFKRKQYRVPFGDIPRIRHLQFDDISGRSNISPIKSIPSEESCFLRPAIVFDHKNNDPIS